MSMKTIENAILRGLAFNAMDLIWHREWVSLSNQDQLNISNDFISADCSAREYHDRIYTGNLQTYAETIR